MKYRICTEEKEIASLIWNVAASFGYVEGRYELSEGETTFEKLSRIAVEDGSVYSVILGGIIGKKAISEIVAVAIEASLAIGFPNFIAELKCSGEVSELLYLYGLDDYIEMSEGDFELIGKSGDEVIFRSSVGEDCIKCNFDLSASARATKDEGIIRDASKIVVFAEKDAEGIAYEISYTLRLSGCLVMNYLENDGIEKCEEYSKQEGASSIIRAFSDGKLQIKELSSGEIIETDYNTFVGYYNDEDDCDCGHDHHECDCGHDHHECDCGHEHHN